MSRIVFFCIPAHGHTNPTLGVVRELCARGHQVWYYSYEMMRGKIEAAGAVFVPCDDADMEQKLTPKDASRIGRDLAFSVEILVDTTLALDDRVCADMKKIRPDCIVADSMAVWGKAAALKLGIPFVCSTTTFAFNRHSAGVMKQSVGEVVRLLISMPRISRQIGRLKRKGYPVKNVLDLIGSDNDTHTIVYTSAGFQPDSETFSDKYAFVGPSVRPAAASIAKTREKLVYLSMGTVNNEMTAFYRDCIRALAGTEYQVIMSVGSRTALEEPGNLPENVSVFPHVDQIAVLEKADVFVSHCGMNSVSESLYFGVPLVMLPVTTEQGGVAARVEELGAGIRAASRDGDGVLAAIGRVLSGDTYRRSAQAIAEEFRRCPGAKGAADKLLKVCGGLP